MTHNKITLFITVIFIVLTSGYWIWTNNKPFAWDQANYLTASETLYQSLNNQDYYKFLDQTTSATTRKPPLLTYLPLPLFILFGSSDKVALLVNIVFLVLFVIFFYKLSKDLFNEKVATLAILITLFTPLFYGLQRQFLVEYGLTTLIVIWLYLIPKTNKFQNIKYTLLLGVVSGLGMLMKLHFFLFITGGFLYYLYSNYGLRIFQTKLLKGLICLFLPAIILMLPWYSKNILTALWHAKRATNPEVLGIFYYGNPFSLKVVYLTLVDLINYVISPYFFVVLLTLIFCIVIKNKKLKPNYFLISALVPAFLVFFFGPNKDYRFMSSFIPFIALFIAALYFSVFKNYKVLLLLSVAPLLIYIHLTVLNISLLNNLKLGDILISDKRIGRFVEQAKPAHWPNEEVLKMLSSLEPLGKIKTISLLSEHEEFNINNLTYYRLKNNLPIILKTSAYYPPDTSISTISKDLNISDYLIVKLGIGKGPSDLNKNVEQTLNNLTWSQVPNNFVFPDGSKLVIFKNPKYE